MTSVGDYDAPVVPRPGIRAGLIDRWLPPTQEVPSEGYMPEAPSGNTPVDGTSTDNDRAWGDAPFVLIAIVNRIDLATAACSTNPGELRFVYGVLGADGVTPLPMTIIVEIPYSGSRTAVEWARRYHAAAAEPSTPVYAERLAEVVRAAIDVADPRAARVRTNEQAFGASWELREFVLTGTGSARDLVMRPLETTPRSDIDPKRIDAHVLERSSEILEGPVSLPPELRAGTAQMTTGQFRWTSTALNASLMQAFSRETCNGCHAGETQTMPFQHIALIPRGGAEAALSPFMNVELTTRAAALELLLAATCKAGG